MEEQNGEEKKWLFRRPYWITLAVLLPPMDAFILFGGASDDLTIRSVLLVFTLFNGLFLVLPVTLVFWLIDFVRPGAV